ncbi:ubiquinone biosynthesis protein COQ7-like protein [Burkholderia multivorans]|nr:ubiquinone biosynthesis protein COQ7-like protein [Burkholderia multivorans]
MVLDELISEFDRGLRSLTGISRMSRPVPAPAEAPAAELTPAERTHAAGLMRVGITSAKSARRRSIRRRSSRHVRRPPRRCSRTAAREEEDHLAWTAHRLKELDSRPSVLNPLWYAGALAIGVAAGTLGDKVSLGFMAETERQVESHLDGHLSDLPAGDTRVARESSSKCASTKRSTARRPRMPAASSCRCRAEC